MSSPRSMLVGVAAALVAPWHLGGRRLKRLLAPVGAGPDVIGTDVVGTGAVGPAAVGTGPVGTGPVVTDAAARWARRGVRILSWLPFSPWRNTCLYRAVAGCLAVRWLGGDAVVRIGTRRDPATGEIVAHAWIAGTPDEPAPDAGYRILEVREGQRMLEGWEGHRMPDGREGRWEA